VTEPTAVKTGPGRGRGGGGRRATSWKPGQSGNPKGCPKGARHRVTLLLDAIGEEYAERVLKSCLLKACKGDVAAQKVVLERCWPPRKGAPVQINIPKITSPEGVLEATAGITEAVGAGELSPDEGVLVSQIVEASRRAIETVELERRIAALEAGAGGGPNRPDTEGNRQVEAPRPMSRPFTGGVS
jgi:Family of unknown function (DUF5681)